jgi:hypothetical protein
MTKRVRIENADNTNHRVIVNHQELSPEGWKDVHSHEVKNLETYETWIYNGKRVIISEAPVEETPAS